MIETQPNGPVHISGVVKNVLEGAQRQRIKAIFEYLDDLRDSGVTNMFGAAPYLMEEFDMPRAEARKFLTDWMQTYAERHPS